jgi:hypothetical protein
MIGQNVPEAALAAILDRYSRAVVGGSMSEIVDCRLAMDALDW